MSEPEHKCRGYHKKLKELTEEESLQILTAIILTCDAQELNELDEEGFTIISVCCQLGYTKHVEKLLEIPHVEVRVKNKEGDEAIHVLCKHTDNADIAEKIGDRNPDALTAVNSEGNQAVHLGVKFNREKILKFLVSQKDVSLAVLGENGKLPLRMAIDMDNITMFNVIYDSCKTCPDDIKDEDGNQPIHWAAAGAAQNILVHLIDAHKVSLYTKGRVGKAPIHLAAEFDKLETVKFFLERDPDLLNVKDDKGNQPIHCAAIGGARNVLVHLIDTMLVSLYTKGQHGGAPIHCAAQFDKLETVKFFLARDPKLLNVKNDYGNQPIHWAAIGGAQNVLDHLVIRDTMKVILFTKGEHGGAPIHFSAKYNKLETVKFFIERDPELLNVKDDKGNQPIHWAAIGGAQNVIVHFIDTMKVSLNSKGQHGGAPIHFSAQFNKLETVKFFLERDPDLLNVNDDYGNQPIHCAAIGGAQNVLDHLVFIDTMEVILHTKGERGAAPIHFSAKYDKLETVKFFLERDPELLNVKDDKGKTPLSYISKERKKIFLASLIKRNYLLFKSFKLKLKAQIIQVLYKRVDLQSCKCLLDIDAASSVFLLARDITTTKTQRFRRYQEIKAARRSETESILHFYARYGFVDVAQVAIELEYDVNERDAEQRTPLLLASQMGHDDMFHFLMDNHADIKLTDRLGRNCLHVAAAHSHAGMVNTVLTCGLDVNSRDFTNRTPLMEAAIHGNTETAKILLENGADLDTADREGNTALCHAALNKNIGLCMLLAEEGSNLNSITSDNKTVLDCIQECVPTAANIIQGLVAIHGMRSSPSQSWWKFTDGNDRLGSGSFGIVRKAVTLQGNFFIAVKTSTRDTSIFTEDNQLTKRTCNELNTYRSLLPHPNIVHVFEATINAKSLNIAMEFVDGMNLKEKLITIKPGRLDSNTICFYMRQLLEALRCLQSQNIIHRDVKPANIMVTSENILKLADFGLAKQLEILGTKTESDCGTPVYKAPEVHAPTGFLSLRRAKPRYSYKADIWSAGCVLFEMITTCLPWGNVREMRELLEQDSDTTAETLEVFDSTVAEDRRSRKDAGDLLKLPYFTS